MSRGRQGEPSTGARPEHDRPRREETMDLGLDRNHDDVCCLKCGSPLERRGCWEPYGEGYVRRTWLECPRCDPVL